MQAATESGKWKTADGGSSSAGGPFSSSTRIRHPDEEDGSENSILSDDGVTAGHPAVVPPGAGMRVQEVKVESTPRGRGDSLGHSNDFELGTLDSPKAR